ITDNKIAGPGGGVYRRKGTNTLNIYNSIIAGNEQKKSSSNVDTYESNAQEPEITSSIIDSNTLNLDGNQITGADFNNEIMLDSSIQLDEKKNSARIYKMT